MIKRLWAWLIRIERSQRPPLLQEQEQSQVKAPPPPPPRAETPAEPLSKEVPKPPRGLRLIKGLKTEADGDAQEVEASSAALSEGSQAAGEAHEATGTEHPSVKLVFSDGSTSRLTASGPAGVRIRYLAENILPPEGS